MNAAFDLATLAPLAAAMLGTGVAAGIMAGLLGVGGGIVIVPVQREVVLVQRLQRLALLRARERLLLDGVLILLANF